MGFIKVLFWIGIILGSVFYIQNPDTFKDHSELVKNAIDGFLNKERDSIELTDLNATNFSDLDSNDYEYIGRILVEEDCESSQECNNHYLECANNCLCVSGSCIKQI